MIDAPTKYEVVHPKLEEYMHLQEMKVLSCNWVKVTQDVAQYPLHHVTYAPTKFEVVTSKGLGGGAFTTKYII